MSKIAVLENNFLSTVTMRRALMNALSANGYNVRILSFGINDFELQLQEINAETTDIGTSNTNPLQVLRYLRRMYRELKKSRPDVCLTFTPRQNIYGNIVCRLLGIPVISNITGTGVPFHIKGVIYAFGRLLYRVVLKNPKVVFFQNADDLEHLVKEGYVAGNKAVLIPGSGIETARYSPRPKPPYPKFVFLFIGRLVKVKGIEELVAAAKNILKTHKESEFWIVGPLWTQNTGKLTVTASEIAGWEQEGIIFKGELKDVREVLAACDCLVLPSHREGMSNSILEACSMERPVVTTDVTGCRDIIQNGINGFLCEPGNALSLEAELRRMMALPEEQRLQMGKAGREIVKAKFEKSVVIDKYLTAIKQILN